MKTKDVKSQTISTNLEVHTVIFRDESISIWISRPNRETKYRIDVNLDRDTLTVERFPMEEA